VAYPEAVAIDVFGAPPGLVAGRGVEPSTFQPCTRTLIGSWITSQDRPVRLGRLEEYYASTARMITAVGARLVLADAATRALICERGVELYVSRRNARTALLVGGIESGRGGQGVRFSGCGPGLCAPADPAIPIAPLHVLALLGGAGVIMVASGLVFGVFGWAVQAAIRSAIKRSRL
jgi:hypothetical protein